MKSTIRFRKARFEEKKLSSIKNISIILTSARSNVVIKTTKKKSSCYSNRNMKKNAQHFEKSNQGKERNKNEKKHEKPQFKKNTQRPFNVIIFFAGPLSK